MNLSRRATAIWLAACCVATFVAKWVINEPRTSINHGDISFYYTVAKNLAEGRGFQIDYIWNFWNRPEGFPTPSNVWWMPLPSVLCALGMAIGGVSYLSAKLTMIAVTSVLPLLVYLLGRELFTDRRVGLLAATLSVTFHLFMDQPCAPLSHGPYLVLATLSLLLIVRSVTRPAYLFWAGLAIGFTQLARSDGILLFAPLLLTHLAHRSRPGWKRAALVPLGYVIAMAPWWAHNLGVHGALMPGGSFRAVFLREYEQWYSLPDSVTATTWLADGWGPVLELKRIVMQHNLVTAATGLVAGASDRKAGFDHLALVAVLGLAWLGLLTMFRRVCVPFWTQFAAEWSFYSLVFTAVGLESFRSGMFSLYPMLMLAAASGLLLALRLPALLVRAGPVRERLVSGAALACAGLIVWGQFGFAQEAMQRKAAGVDRLNDFYRVFQNRVIVPHGMQDAVIMARDVHQLHALTGLRCVQIPYEPERVIREVARRYGVTHLLLMGEPGLPSTRPGLTHIDVNPNYELIEGPSRMYGQTFRVYRLIP